LPSPDDPALLVGFDKADDASAYMIDEETVLLQTVDIFPPVVDDPYIFGQIAAANAVSDIYAMGGKPLLAMNIFCCPEDLPEEIAGEILKGGYDKINEAGAMITGGHTIKDREPKYGLAVTGFVHPRHLLTNRGAKEGDIIILTKPLGTGILTTAAKAGLLGSADTEEMIKSMTSLNDFITEAVNEYDINACTDVTGFGLLGHCYEMAEASGLTAVIKSKKVPYMKNALELAKAGIIPAGAYANIDHIKCRAKISPHVPEEMSDVMHDPQTSGGLLISMNQKEAEKFLKSIKKSLPDSCAIGVFSAKKDVDIIVET